MTIRISNWYTRGPKGASPYQAPEIAGVCVAGTVNGHPKKPDGMRVTTSPIVRIAGRRFWTESGNAYELDGEPSEKFLLHLKSVGREYDAAEPIKLVGAPR